MLEGDGLLYLPRYDPARLPAVVVVRCGCGSRYAVLTGAHVGGVEAVKSRAEAGGLVFVDARAEPFKLCGCGTFLDFCLTAEAAAVM